jgi:hypothetical protein
MNIKLETLVKLIGENKLEQILQNYLKGDQAPTEQVAKVATNNPKLRVKRILGARVWTEEEEIILAGKASALRASGKSWGQTCKLMAVELYRTPSAIGNHISKLQRTGKMTK